MKKRNALPRLVLGAILLALPAAADAPRNPPQYAQFLADTSTITDNFTKLQWERRPMVSDPAPTWLQGKARCPTLNALFPIASGGPGRLPTLKELLTLLDEEPHNEYELNAVVPKMIDQLAFADTPVGLPYWSSTPAGSGMYWALSFKTGLMQALPEAANANVRCVR